MAQVRLLACFRARPGLEDDLHEILCGLLAPTRQEPGCVRYDLWRSETDPRDFVFVEEWSSQADLDAHARSAHLTAASVHFERLVEEGPTLRSYRLVE